MERQAIREQFNFDFDAKHRDGGTLEAAEGVTCALMCVAYAIGDLAEAVWAIHEAKRREDQG